MLAAGSWSLPAAAATREKGHPLGFPLVVDCLRKAKKTIFRFFFEGGNKTIDLNSGNWSFSIFTKEQECVREREQASIACVEGKTKCRRIVYRKIKLVENLY